MNANLLTVKCFSLRFLILITDPLELLVIFITIIPELVIIGRICSVSLVVSDLNSNVVFKFIVSCPLGLITISCVDINGNSRSPSVVICIAMAYASANSAFSVIILTAHPYFVAFFDLSTG